MYAASSHKTVAALSWGYKVLLKNASLVAQTVKNLPAMQETQVQSLEKDPTPVFLPREFHGQRSLVAIVHRVAKSRT